MQSKNVNNMNTRSKVTKANGDTIGIVNAKTKARQPVASPHAVVADTTQNEEIPTVPLGSLETIDALQPEVMVHSVAATRSIDGPASLVAQPSEYRRSIGEWTQVWWDGIRPPYLLFPLLPVCVGSVVAWLQTISAKKLLGHFHTTHFIGMILAISLIQIGANLVNDYYDYLRGIDIGNALGPGMLIQQGLAKPARVLWIGLGSLIVGGIIGLIVAAAGGPLVYFLGAVGLACAYFYSATSRSLSSLVLGELTSFLLFGPLIALGAYMVMAQNGRIDRTVLSYGISLGLLAVAAVHANNMRDFEGDIHANKHSLATLLGLQGSRWLYGALVLTAYIPILTLAIPRGGPHFLLLTLWTLPTLVVVLSGIVRTDVPAGFHLVMQQTLKLETYFTLFLIVGLLFTAFLPFLPSLPSHLLP